jgi:hypothetical protein
MSRSSSLQRQSYCPTPPSPLYTNKLSVVHIPLSFSGLTLFYTPAVRREPGPFLWPLALTLIRVAGGAYIFQNFEQV